MHKPFFGPPLALSVSMKLTGLDVFDAAVERSTIWLQDLMQELNWDDRRQTFFALRSVLQCLRDHFDAENAARIGNQLPLLIRGAYYENWEPKGQPKVWKSSDDLLHSVCQLAEKTEMATPSETIVQAVFRLLDKKATAGELEDLQNILPPDLRVLWPHTRHAA
jgi:uncharacterized protein (DUF2267 family)